MTEHVNVPKLRFDEFKESSLQQTTLKNVLSLFNGFAFKSTDSVGNGVRWIKIADVGIQEISDKNISYLPVGFLEKYKKFKLDEGDIVVALTRPVLNGKLKIAYIDEESKNSLLNQRVAKLLSNEHLDYVYYQVQCNRVITSIVQNIAGTDPPNLAPSEINHIKVSLPVLPEQQKIASFLSKVDEKISLLSEKKDKLTEYKKGVMQQLFNGKWGYVDGKEDGQLTFIPPTLRFKADDSEFPDWEEKTLIELADQRLSNGVFNDPKRIGKGYKLINVKDMYSGNFIDTLTLSLLDLSEKEFSNNQVKYGDIFFTRSSLVPSGIAYSNVNLSNDDDITYDGHLIKFSPKLDMISPYYFANYLRSYSSRKALISRGKQSTMTTIGQEDIKDIRLLIPSLAEQTKIAKFLSSIDRKIDLTNSELEKAKEWKKGLLQQMFV
ncbi:restriction endonuclease subunit S [Vibrio sp. B1Z05]|uniref:restriction endonuclease subunit S n=1 Tax=Vibrio sp. B1Z05 TaxID=2654980 RepID=UPI001562754D|nr:restriction endonuclease subunit S [Vibrio sp. B1Z05]